MHAITSLAGVVITCKDIQASVQFYRTLGMDLRETRHGGPVHFACALGGCQLSLYPDDGVERGVQSGTQLGFTVSNLDSAIAALKAAGARIIAMPSPKPWGITAVVVDPDGRQIELVATRVEVSGPMPF